MTSHTFMHKDGRNDKFIGVIRMVVPFKNEPGIDFSSTDKC